MDSSDNYWLRVLILSPAASSCLDREKLCSDPSAVDINEAGGSRRKQLSSKAAGLAEKLIEQLEPSLRAQNQALAGLEPGLANSFSVTCSASAQGCLGRLSLGSGESSAAQDGGRKWNWENKILCPTTRVIYFFGLFPCFCL
jgi:hypothetical protein